MKNRASNGPRHGRQRIALVVDDESDICELIKDALEETELTVWSAGTAEKGIELAAYYVIDFCFVDIFMPGKGGVWLIEAIRDQHPEAEIVAMSGGFGDVSAEKAMRAAEKLGVRYRLTKPFLVDDILSLVRHALGEDGARAPQH